MKKRFLAALLCLCMTLALLPTTAFAAGTMQLSDVNTDGLGLNIADASNESFVIGLTFNGIFAMKLTNVTSSICSHFFLGCCSLFSRRAGRYIHHFEELE